MNKPHLEDRKYIIGSKYKYANTARSTIMQGYSYYHSNTTTQIGLCNTTGEFPITSALPSYRMLRPAIRSLVRNPHIGWD